MSNKEETLKKFRDLQADQWADVRDPNTYQYKVIDYPFGSRRVAIHDSRCESLQASRSADFNPEIESYDEFVEKFQREFQSVSEIDRLRAQEIQALIQAGKISVDKTKIFYEYGFRCTLILNLWKEYMSGAKGCDIVQTCVDVASDLGYSVERIDLNTETPDLSSVGLISAYHVLEHLTDPLECIQRTYNSLPNGAVFHVEIPIEPDGPRLRYGHLFPFHPGDLLNMLKLVGFEVIHYTNQPFPGGPPIERALAKK